MGSKSSLKPIKYIKSIASEKLGIVMPMYDNVIDVESSHFPLLRSSTTPIPIPRIWLINHAMIANSAGHRKPLGQKESAQSFLVIKSNIQ